MQERKDAGQDSCRRLEIRGKEGCVTGERSKGRRQERRDSGKQYTEGIKERMQKRKDVGNVR